MTDSTPQGWGISESRSIKPFRTAESALEACGFRLTEDDPFLSSVPWRNVVDAEIGVSSLKPSFEFRLDLERLRADSGIEVGELEFGVIVRDPAILTSRCIERWAVTDIPQHFAIPKDELERLSGYRGLDFVLVITPVRNLEPSFRIANKPGQIVASRTYEFRRHDEGTDFPIEFVDPQDFERMQPSRNRNTFWTIEWRDESADYDRPVSEVLRILLNSDVRNKLLRISDTDPVGRLLWLELATEACLEICLKVFDSDPLPPENQDGLLWKLTERLRQNSELEFEDFVLMSRRRHDAHAFFRSHVQSAFAISATIQRTSLVRG